MHTFYPFGIHVATCRKCDRGFLAAEGLGAD